MTSDRIDTFYEIGLEWRKDFPCENGTVWVRIPIRRFPEVLTRARLMGYNAEIDRVLVVWWDELPALGSHKFYGPNTGLALVKITDLGAYVQSEIDQWKKENNLGKEV